MRGSTFGRRAGRIPSILSLSRSGSTHASGPSVFTWMLGDWQGLASKLGFVDLKSDRLQYGSVGRNFFAQFQKDDITHDNIPARNSAICAIPENLDGNFVVDLVENVELLIGLILIEEGKRGSKKNGNDDANALNKMTIGSACNYSDDRRNHQNADHRIIKLFEIKFPPRISFAGGQNICTMEASALFDT